MEKGSSSSSSPATGAAESLNGLQFGKKIYFEDVGSGLDSKTGSGPLSSPAKKGRVGVAHGGQPPRCQVEGCLLDLSDAKAYYSRHKVCGMHSKSSTVIVAGIEQRFCQQCSRFHKLTEFDQGKRSCRRRLACHNERRRKPPSGSSSVFSSPYGSLSPNMFDRKTGGFLMDLTAYSTPAGQGPWPNAARGLGNHQLQLPWQTNIHDHPLPSYSNHGVSSVECCFFNGVSDSSSALSLLSNQESWASRSRPSNIGLNGFHGTNANANGTTTEFQPSVNHPVGQSPDLGLGQISVNGQYNINGEQLGLGQPNEGRFHHLDHSRGYDSFV